MKRTHPQTHTLKKHVEHAVQPLSLPPGVDPEHKSATSFVLRFVVLFTLLNASALRQSKWGNSLYSCHLSSGDVASHQQPLSRVWHFCFPGLRRVWRPKRNLISRICPFYLLLSCTLTWPKTNFIKQGEDERSGSVPTHRRCGAVIKCCYFSMQDTQRSAQGHHCSLSVCTLCVCCEPQPICRLLFYFILLYFILFYSIVESNTRQNDKTIYATAAPKLPSVPSHKMSKIFLIGFLSSSSFKHK